MKLNDIARISVVDFEKDNAEIYYLNYPNINPNMSGIFTITLNSAKTDLIECTCQNPEEFLIKEYISNIRELALSNSNDFPMNDKGLYEIKQQSFDEIKKQLFHKVISFGSTISVLSRIGPGNVVLSHPSNIYIEGGDITSLKSYKTTYLKPSEVLVFRNSSKLEDPGVSIVLSDFKNLGNGYKRFKYAITKTGFYPEKNYLLFNIKNILEERKQKLRNIEKTIK